MAIVGFEVGMAAATAVVSIGVWVWALVDFLRTPRAGFASDVEWLLTLCLLLLTNLVGVLAWFFVMRPLVRSRLLDLEDEHTVTAPPAERWRRHLAP